MFTIVNRHYATPVLMCVMVCFDKASQMEACSKRQWKAMGIGSFQRTEDDSMPNSLEYMYVTEMCHSNTLIHEYLLRVLLSITNYSA